jgi:hypothetical protein
MYSHDFLIKMKKYFDDPKVKQTIQEIDAKYSLTGRGIVLELLFAFVRGGELDLNDIGLYLYTANNLDLHEATVIEDELDEKIFEPIEDLLSEARDVYLKRKKEEPGFKGLDELILEQPENPEETEVASAEERAKMMSREVISEDVIFGVIGQAELKLGSLFRKRLFGILEKRFKGIRDDMETKETLMKSEKIGGMGFDEETSRRLIKLVSAHLAEYQKFAEKPRMTPLLRIKEERVKPGEVKEFVEKEKGVAHLPSIPLSMGETQRESVNEKQVSILPPSSSLKPRMGDKDGLGEMESAAMNQKQGVSLSQLKQSVSESSSSSKTVPIGHSKDPKLDFDHQLMPPPPALIWPEGKPKLKYKNESTVARRPQLSPTNVEAAKGKQSEANIPPISPETMKQQNVVNKRLIQREEPKKEIPPDSPVSTPPPQAKIPEKKPPHDIIPEVPAYASKLTDLLSDIANMSLKDFQKLDPDAKKACGKIREKIQLLEQDRGLPGCTDGIRAWQSSEAYENYVAIGKEALMSGKKIDEVISAWNGEGKPAITKAQFDAIMELNREMKY